MREVGENEAAQPDGEERGDLTGKLIGAAGYAKRYVYEGIKDD